MKIRKEQMEAFSEAAVKDFEDRVLQDLQEFYPVECRALKEAGVRAIIRKGIKNAEKYKIVAEHDVCLYIDLMFMLGEDFDTDARIPWAEAILTDQPEDPTAKIERLYDTADDYLSEAGKE